MSNQNAPTAIIVGSGPGGLASALLLAHSGVNVTVLEKADAVGLLAPYLNKILNTESGNRWFEEEAPSLFTREFLQVVASFR